MVHILISFVIYQLKERKLKVSFTVQFFLFKQAIHCEIKNNQFGANLSGNTGFKFLGRSMADYVRKAIQGETLFKSKKFPLPEPSGDFNFDEYDGCKPEKILDQFIPVTMNEEFKEWLQNNLKTIRNLFPNANISFTLPSTLRSKISEDAFLNFSNLLQSEVIKQSVSYIEQSPFQTLVFYAMDRITLIQLVVKLNF